MCGNWRRFIAKLSILIVNYKTADFLERCLLSARKFYDDADLEICVIDNASGDGSGERIRREFPSVQWIQNEINRGFAAALNQGLKATSSPYVLWLNPDSEFLDAGLLGLIDYLKQHPETAILGPQILNPDQSIQLSARSFPSYQTAVFNRYSLVTKLFPGNPVSRRYLRLDLERSQIHEVDWVSGACLLHRREVLEKIGALDENFFMYCEDVDFCFRAKKAGWKVQYHPGAKVLHHIGGSSRFRRRGMIAQHHRSMWLYYKKNFSRNILQDAVVGVAILARCLFLVILPVRKGAAKVDK